jgi:small subunit ribosomal protein S18e
MNIFTVKIDKRSMVEKCHFSSSDSIFVTFTVLAFPFMPLEVVDSAAFRDMVRLLSTNVEGRKPLYLALTAIGGLGRRFAHAVALRAGLDPLRRAGTLTTQEEERIVSVIQNPVENGIPVWMLNRRFDRATGKNVQWSGEDWRGNVRTEIDRLKKMRCWRGLRHANKLKVRGQCTKSTGRRGVAVGVDRKK